MKIYRFWIYAVAFICLSLTAADVRADQGQAPVKKADFFDSLNQGNEVILTPLDCAVPDNSRKTEQKLERNDDDSLFQVQIMATKILNDAEKEKKRIEETLGITVYLISESPFYKLRAGKFYTKKEAEELKTEMTEIGHKEAWIVKTRK